MRAKKKRVRDPRSIERGSRIRERRQALKLSQEYVARALGLESREAVSQWERGTVLELEHGHRIGLCKLLGFEERELLLDPENNPKEFEMPLSPEAKSIAYRWDDIPETLRTEFKRKMAEFERMARDNPQYAKHLFPELDSVDLSKLQPRAKP